MSEFIGHRGSNGGRLTVTVRDLSLLTHSVLETVFLRLYTFTAVQNKQKTYLVYTQEGDIVLLTVGCS